ncbi:PRD domain protein (TIGR03582 family) [Raoultella sp. BIGb0399]|nr:PRD domain protein (TIGR03582 family) [Raoultella sp. BIGb0399]
MQSITLSVRLSTSKWKTTRYKLQPLGASFIPRDINGVTQVNNGAVINDVGEQATQTELLAEKMLQQVYALLSRRNIIPNAVQEQMLTSHVRAMAHRSISGEPLPEVDASLFEEISEDSMMLAREVVAEFGNLPEEESWLLSVHFEVAKDNL